LLRFWLVAADAQKTPRAVASRGFLPKLKSRSTSANGVANYDDYQQNDLSDVF